MFDSLPTLTVREARPGDLLDLVAIDAARYDRVSGVEPLDQATVATWLATQSPFFLVAEEDGVPRHFSFGMIINFHPDDPHDIRAFTEAPSLDAGYTEHTHDAEGNALYGISIASSSPAAAEALQARMHELILAHNIQYTVGFSRMPLLRFFVRKAREVGRQEDISTLATGYARDQAAKAGGFKVWRQTPCRVPGMPVFTRPDPVIQHHLSGHQNCTLLATCPYMSSDAGSMGHGALLAAKTIH